MQYRNLDDEAKEIDPGNVSIIQQFKERMAR